MHIARSSYSLTNLKLGLGLIRRFTINVSGHNKNHYDSLGVTPKATQGDIKTAYYKLSKAYHPDLNKGDESAAEKFRSITSAYEILGNVKSRKTYDRGLLVGSYQHDEEVETKPREEKYPHAPFYHHRNKPASRKTHAGTDTNYNIDEWTRAHYSKMFDQQSRVKNAAYTYRANASDDEKDLQRFISTFSVIIFLTSCFLMYRADAAGKFDSSSKRNDKPD